MDNSNRKGSNGAVEQIMRNMISDIHSTDGQYRQLGFPPPPVSTESWGITNQLQQNSFVPPFNIHNPEVPMPFQTISNQCNPPTSFNYNHQNQVFSDEYNKHISENDLYTPSFNLYQNMQQDIGMFAPDYKFMSYHNMNTMPESVYLQHEDLNGILNVNNSLQNHHSPNRTPLIDNLVGNWVPNTTGTYSPFGNIPLSNMANIFDNQSNCSNMDCLNNMHHQEMKQNTQEYLDRTNEDHYSFQFNTRDTKKPRIIAEVKPMRPSYSDVLLKSAPQANKTGKPEVKDTKQKKENKKSLKNDKIQKINGLLNRSNTNNEMKDLPGTEKSNLSKNNEKNAKDSKVNQLNRKWVSLDNVTESLNDLKTESSDSRKIKKPEEIILNKSTAKINQQKSSKTSNEQVETDSGSGKNDTLNTVKNSVKKGTKPGLRQKNCDLFGSNERPPGKRSQRSRKRDSHVPLGVVRQKLKLCLRGWWKFFVGFILWLFHLVSDICSMSVHLIHDGVKNLWTWIVINWGIFLDTTMLLLKRVRLFTWVHEKFKKTKEKEEKRGFVRTGLQNNINMPMTGDEAMKRLLACKGKDPYSILGLSNTCTDEDIKRYYKKQAVLVHPDKNKQPGAEEAFKILVHAFDMIGEPERRAAYDKGVEESVQVEQAWTELTELLAQFQQKVEAAAKTIRCSACGLGHKRIKIDRPSYAARNCSTCKIHHSAREGDIWAEAKCFGFLWHYYACMEGGVYDITEWAGCQKGSLKQLKPDSHNVQYRIALGKQNGSSKKHNSSPRGDDTTNLENLLNRFYGQTDNTQNARRKNKKFSK